MRIAVASGKGGTGKTTVAVNLAVTAARSGRSVAYLDADVEEPNGHLFLKPEITDRETVTRLIPAVDTASCTLCGQCSSICAYGAIAKLGRKIVVFPELCHSCGGCARVCPAEAITEVSRPVGKVSKGDVNGLFFAEGLLDVGQAMSPPVINAVKKSAPASTEWVLIDAPPGTACPAVEALRDSDFALLVAEPTRFGLHDLGLAVDLIKALGLPHAVVINRAGMGDDRVAEWCRSENIPLLASIPEDCTAAKAVSSGELLCDALPAMKTHFEELLKTLDRALQGAVV